MNTEGYTVFTGPLKHGPKGNQAVKKAEKQGVDVQYYKKSEHSNKNALDGKKIYQIMNDEDNQYKAPTMPQQLRIAIAQARNSKGWNQEQFAREMQIPKSDVNSWEAGKSVPSGNMIAKMDKVLGIKLPRPPKKK